MLNYLFEKFDTIKQMIYHSVNKSIIDLILRILCIDIPFIDAKMTLFLVLYKMTEFFKVFKGTTKRNNVTFIRNL